MIWINIRLIIYLFCRIFEKGDFMEIISCKYHEHLRCLVLRATPSFSRKSTFGLRNATLLQPTLEAICQTSTTNSLWNKFDRHACLEKFILDFSLPDEGYSRNAACALNLISTFYWNIKNKNKRFNLNKINTRWYLQTLLSSFLLPDSLYIDHVHTTLYWTSFCLFITKE